ncbi:MAG: anti-sigma regulatory factor [Candidatus Aminicenantes bacterium]|nr:anti-sigma regulatory factor [Candidatus Aminicenantes bacterium]NIM82495.1 anti-sigma regulatory factor [Candidatus Aminicenantes bacterium]NIN19047.1 anti-sigma regulatory factor [Candidatus Aminicenantes bacterium]NIN42949.1 anti-sigma regulatory factor [Candidatus Aminicenantes bacterium]NIN85686.1 anti-sigma regulatory factor [Candidatus Aminicenantes bacterium]
MPDNVIFRQRFKIKGGDFINGGDASIRIGDILKEVGIDPDIILRVTVAAYEAEMNVVIYAQRGTMDFCITNDKVLIKVEDEGRGIEDIELAMQDGYSTASEEIREMGFGAGMGLPNIKENADAFNISSQVGKGTKLEIIINLPDKK